MQIRVSKIDREFRYVFRISYKARSQASMVVVELDDGGIIGRAEAHGVAYLGETADSIIEQLAGVASDLRNGMSRTELQGCLPAGGARNALDCALWDLESKRAGCRAWELAGLPSVRPIATDFTLSLDTPEAMRRAAAAATQYSQLKIKLTGEGDLERLRSIREARPNADLIVDANQGWSVQQLHDFTPRLAELGVKLIEQPLPIGADEALVGFDSPIPICADESCQTTESLPALLGKYQFINIKLDKTGGLTEALRLVEAARMSRLGLMVGCMAGSSLAMAPAFLIGQLCEFVDLDGPLHLKCDVTPAISYAGDRMLAPDPGLWG